MNIFDLHCDTLTEALKAHKTLMHSGLQLDGETLPEELLLAQTFGVFIPDTLRGKPAMDYFLRCADYWQRQMGQEESIFRPVTAENTIERIWQQKKHAALLSVEGGAVLAGDTANVSVLKQQGVWMLTLTWNGQNELGSGAEAIGGLTAFGREVLPLLEQNRIIADVSHLNEETFWDVLKIAKRPVAASHSCSRALCDVPRNLTDDQMRAISERGGLVGLNFYPVFLSHTPGKVCIDDILRHAEHFLNLGGEKVLALGSDFDGADMPSDLPNAAHLPLLAEKLAHAFGKELTAQICYKNALDFYRRNAAE